MDHLPVPNDAVLKDSIQVPLYATEPYDGEEFESYPSRHGWQISGAFSVTRISHRGKTVDEAEAGSMLQTWLFFGLIFAVTGELGNLDTFRRTDTEGHEVLTTASLGKLIGEWSQRMIQNSSFSADNLHSWRTKAYDCLIKARYAILEVKATAQYAGLGLLCMSVALLGEYLMQAMKDIYIKFGLDSPTAQHWRVRGYSDCGEPLVKAMVQGGWCPNRLAALDAGTVMSVGQLWFLANMKSPRTSLSHRNCTASSCDYTVVNEHDYKTRHDTEYCEPGCALVGPPPAAVDSALKGDLIPLITLSHVDGDHGTRNELSMHAEPQSRDAEFTAISHVWSDGHGNPHGNLLPSCFLKRLMLTLGRLPRTIKGGRLPLGSRVDDGRSRSDSMGRATRFI